MAALQNNTFMNRMYYRHPILALLLLGLLAHSASAGQDQVALLLCGNTYAALRGPLGQYIRDVEARFPVKVHVVKGRWETPHEVREAIKSLHDEKAIGGVILVGAMPMHRFFMHEHPNPNPLYYEDFNLEFVDTNKDGVDDAYKGTPHLKVWVANIRAHSFSAQRSSHRIGPGQGTGSGGVAVPGFPRRWT
jgi:hypothetical protein